MSYLRNMLAKPTAVAAAQANPQPSAGDWSPFASHGPVEPAAPAKAAPKRVLPKVQMVKPMEEVADSPAKVAQAKPATSASPAAPTNLLRADVD
jgi:hypothetical protein